VTGCGTWLWVGWVDFGLVGGFTTIIATIKRQLGVHWICVGVKNEGEEGRRLLCIINLQLFCTFASFFFPFCFVPQLEEGLWVSDKNCLRFYS